MSFWCHRLDQWKCENESNWFTLSYNTEYSPHYWINQEFCQMCMYWELQTVFLYLPIGKNVNFYWNFANCRILSVEEVCISCKCINSSKNCSKDTVASAASMAASMFTAVTRTKNRGSPPYELDPRDNQEDQGVPRRPFSSTWEPAFEISSMSHCLCSTKVLASSQMRPS